MSGASLPITIESGDLVFVLGANGSGKSALIQHFVSSNKEASVRRISAHRKAWFQSGSIDMTPQSRRQFDRNRMRYETTQEARWSDGYEDQRQSAVLFDLVAKENTRAREIARCVDGQDTGQAEKISAEIRSPFSQINELLELGTLRVTLENSNDEEILARHRDTDTPYSISQMSDGERNAAIIAANVLTVEPSTVVLIDEPERHLHRAIIEPLLSALFTQRPDCSFVISTHEVGLPSIFAHAPVLMVRSCRWDSDVAGAWEIQVLEPGAQLPEDLRRSILGARKRILFVEGIERSKDKRLYESLFPDLSVVPKEGCADVIRAVKGLRDSSQLHHVEAYGLIDRDDRMDSEVERLAEGGVYALEVSSVESLFYCRDSLVAVAQRQADSLGREAGDMVESAQRSALESLSESGLAERMAARRCERRLRNELASHFPNWQQIQAEGAEVIDLNIQSPYPGEVERFRLMVQLKELDHLISRYPLRESRALGLIAKALELPSIKTYEDAVLARVREDQCLAGRLRSRIGPLSARLGLGFPTKSSA